MPKSTLACSKAPSRVSYQRSPWWLVFRECHSSMQPPSTSPISKSTSASCAGVGGGVAALAGSHPECFLPRSVCLRPTDAWLLPYQLAYDFSGGRRWGRGRPAGCCSRMDWAPLMQIFLRPRSCRCRARPPRFRWRRVLRPAPRAMRPGRPARKRRPSPAMGTGRLR